MTSQNTDSSTGTERPDLMGIRFAHRMMRRDLHRLTDAVGRIAAGEACTDRRATALVGWVEMLCDEIHHHRTVEDQALMPLLGTRAGAEFDLDELSADHRALDPLLDAVRAAATILDATGPGRRASAGRLGAALTRVRDELDEHIEDEERTMFGLITEYVTAAEWAEIEKRARNSGLPLSFVLPRIVDAAEPSELADFKKAAGPVMVVLHALVRPGYRRRERLVLGA